MRSVGINLPPELLGRRPELRPPDLRPPVQRHQIHQERERWGPGPSRHHYHHYHHSQS